MGKIFYKGVDYSSPTSSGVSGVKGNKETVYRAGNVNITPENVGALAENGDSKDNTVTFTSADATASDAWTDVAVLATGEKHSSLFAKISTMFKNIRYIYTHFIKSENILDTLEEISANTQSGKVAGALAVKELNRNFTWKKADNFATAFNNAKSEVLIIVYFVISDIRHSVELIIPKYNVKDARYVTGSPYSTSSLVYVQFEKVGTNLTIQVFLNGSNLAFTTDILYR